MPALVAGAPAPEPPPTCDESAGPLVFTAPEELDVELPPPDPAVLGSHTTPPVAVTLAPAAEAGEMSDEPGVGLEQVRMAPPIETAAAPPNGLPIPPAIQDSGPNPASIARCSSASITNTGRSRGGGSSTLRKTHGHLLGMARGNGFIPSPGVYHRKGFQPRQQIGSTSDASSGRRAFAGGRNRPSRQTAIDSHAGRGAPPRRSSYRHALVVRRHALNRLEVDAPEVEFEEPAAIIEIDREAHWHTIAISERSLGKHFAEPPFPAITRRIGKTEAPHPAVCHRFDQRLGGEPHVIRGLPHSSGHTAEKTVFGRCDQTHGCLLTEAQPRLRDSNQNCPRRTATSPQDSLALYDGIRSAGQLILEVILTLGVQQFHVDVHPDDLARRADEDHRIGIGGVVRKKARRPRSLGESFDDRHWIIAEV